MREFGTTTSIRRNALVREITHIDIQQFTNMQSYRTKCMELVRKIKEQSISVEEILIYSVLYGLGPEYDAYKLIVQDKIDNKMKPTVESIIESFTNSKEVLTYANELDGKTQAYRIQQGQNKDRHKPKCAYCSMEGTKKTSASSNTQRMHQNGGRLNNKASTMMTKQEGNSPIYSKG